MSTPSAKKQKRTLTSPDQDTAAMTQLGGINMEQLMEQFTRLLDSKLDPILAAIQGVKEEVKVVRDDIQELRKENYELKEKLR